MTARLARVGPAALLSLSLLLAPAARVAACDCDSLAPAEALAASTVAFEGVVSRVVEEAAPGGQPHRPFVDAVLTSFVVEERLKGPVAAGELFELRSDASLGDCSAFFAERQRWRLYLAPVNGRLNTHACAGNELLGEGVALPRAASTAADSPPILPLLAGAGVVVLLVMGAWAFARPGRQAPG